tara:strand:+ start:74601 stop:74846 length:246 start_codon:yes stop_codon:yes gene_type:complete
MKNPSRVKKLLRYIDYIEELLKYYLGSDFEHKFEHDGQSTSIHQMFQLLRSTLTELTLDDKVKSIKLFEKFKKKDQKDEMD